MRGKVPPRHCCFMSSRITPAYAGKSFFFRTNLVQWQDHPRLCGEKHLTVEVTVNDAGSPPPMRGKVTQAV